MQYLLSSLCFSIMLAVIFLSLKPSFHPTQRTQRKALEYFFHSTDAGDARKVRKQVRNERNKRTKSRQRT